jgi:cell division protein FtsW (lipid II flippase)
MLATIAVILIIIWAIGFFARMVGHIIHAVLLVAFLLLLAHYYKLGNFDHFDHDSGHSFFRHQYRTEGK